MWVAFRMKFIKFLRTVFCLILCILFPLQIFADPYIRISMNKRVLQIIGNPTFSIETNNLKIICNIPKQIIYEHK